MSAIPADCCRQEFAISDTNWLSFSEWRSMSASRCSTTALSFAASMPRCLDRATLSAVSRAAPAEFWARLRTSSADNREAQSRVASACRLYRGVERQQVSLKSKSIDHVQNLPDFVVGGLYAPHNQAERLNCLSTFGNRFMRIGTQTLRLLRMHLVLARHRRNRPERHLYRFC